MLTKSLIAIVASTAAALATPVFAQAQGAQAMNATVNATPPPAKTGPWGAVLSATARSAPSTWATTWRRSSSSSATARSMRSATRSGAMWRSVFAIQHPDAVRRLVQLSTPFAQDGFFPEMLPQQAVVGAALAPMMKDTPIYQSYMARAPHPDDFPWLLDRMGEYMRQSLRWYERVGSSVARQSQPKSMMAK